MEKLPILCGAERIGEAETEQERLYICLRVRIPSRRGIWRAWAVGERGEIRIGTLEPVNGESVISRRFSRQSLSKIGTLARVEIRPASVENIAERPASVGNVAEQTASVENIAEQTENVTKQAETLTESVTKENVEAWRHAGKEPLFRCKRFRRQSRHIRDALTRIDGDRRRVALIRDENAPFPMPELFCLASAATIGARDYWVFAFDRHEWPVL
ncbi:MAG: hypothetical protein IJR72_04865 [Oscillospiraceae bacterium]|nr:hypothetical protein [Oscillospiraceae bacterium]